jgi:hypothetical protein
VTPRQLAAGCTATTTLSYISLLCAALAGFVGVRVVNGDPDIPVKGTAAAALSRRLFMPLTVFRNHDDLPF